ncbi:cell cycle checkpoint protein RAD17, partial [Patella vulgata]|uniref:cell cycle checkpoint protein RAD17 n=1 Tax=Patella vulgata TaxID=6465 RepID=UPI00217F98A2
FACRQDTFDLNSTCKSQKSSRKTGKGSGSRLKYESSKKRDSSKTSSEAELAGIGARDTSCFLFHAIGKILHCKRGDPSTYDNLPRLPSHLSHHERHPLLINPEDVVEKSQVSGDYFASFLHQNYVDFYTDIDDVVNASEYLSLVDTFSSQWSTKTALQNYATSLASRGIIHANTSNAKFDAPRSGIGWRPLHKSQWFTVQRQAKKNSETACSLFRGYHWEPEVLWTEILPNLNRINVTMRNPAQISFIQEMGRFCQRSFQNKGEKLDEHEVVDADNEDTTSLPVTQKFDQPGDLISDSQSEVKNKTVEEEEDEKEVEIDEYFDSD